MNTACVETLESRRLQAAYFVDAGHGSDLNSGRGPRQAWQTLPAVSRHTFTKGDKLFLTGTFSGQTLTLGPSAAGVSVNSYLGAARGNGVRFGVANAATLADVSGDGIDITTSGITVQNITIAAAPGAVGSGNYNYGIYLHNSTAAVLSNEVINHVTATGFSYSGLCMQGWNTSTADSAGFSNVLIENSSFFANQVSGIFVGAGDITGNEFQPAFPAAFYVNSNLTIRNCRAYDNAGYNAALHATPDGVNINQGNYTSGGIFISSVNGALVDNCTVYNNCFAALGSVGTWAFDSTRVNFQNDESFDNKTLGGDGDGFDFDHGVTHSIMQRDYSHGNQGFGFLLTTTGGTSNNNGDTIRYCVSDDNNGELAILGTAGAPMLHANIYNNTLLAADTSPANSYAISVAGDAAASVNILNNIFFSQGTDPVAVIATASTSIRFDRNDYWAAAAPTHFNLYLQGSTYNSLAAWAAVSAGEETVNAKLIGLVQDPMLIDQAASDLPGSSAHNLALKHGSPLRHEGLNLASRPWAAAAPFNQNAPYNLAGRAWNGLGKLDFFGRPINRRLIGAG